MVAWQDGPRDSPKPAREDHVGRFEIKARDGRARVGALSTAHGVVTTPTLLPVINPNLRTIEPREMWDRYGIQMPITGTMPPMGCTLNACSPMAWALKRLRSGCKPP